MFSASKTKKPSIQARNRSEEEQIKNCAAPYLYDLRPLLAMMPLLVPPTTVRTDMGGADKAKALCGAGRHPIRIGEAMQREMLYHPEEARRALRNTPPPLLCYAAGILKAEERGARKMMTVSGGESELFIPFSLTG
uniref:Uncharacterized protein n=1 Tax=Setaria viridis TaxID=4556 RepID=A0A4U6WEC1_SETVI|nr:hypothetical protein SEVIR_1G295701v2 [Setaria viridis]